MQLRLCQAGTLFFGVIFSTQVFATQVIKKSSSGICHPPQSSWYERTKNYTAFDSLEACLAVGGRLPKGITLKSADGAPTPKKQWVRVNISALHLVTAGTTQTATVRTVEPRR
jgi:hypothetical protein